MRRISTTWSSDQMGKIRLTLKKRTNTKIKRIITWSSITMKGQFVWGSTITSLMTTRTNDWPLMTRTTLKSWWIMWQSQIRMMVQAMTSRDGSSIRFQNSPVFLQGSNLGWIIMLSLNKLKRLCTSGEHTRTEQAILSNLNGPFPLNQNLSVGNRWIVLLVMREIFFSCTKWIAKRHQKSS